MDLKLLFFTCLESILYISSELVNFTFLLGSTIFLLFSRDHKGSLWIKKKEGVRERLSLKRASIIYITGAEERKARFKKSGESETALQ